MVDALVSAGSNLGDRRAALDQAVELLSKQAGIRVGSVSRWLETSPVGGATGQPPYLNGAVRIETDLPPERLLEALQAVEQALGRQRKERWGPRTVDLDLLLYGNQTLRTARLIVPHPRMSYRRFVLTPALEIAADMVHPELGWDIARIVEHLDRAANYIAITGPPGAGQSALASATCAALGAQGLIAEPAWRDLMHAAPSAGDRALAALGWIDHNLGRLQHFDWHTVNNSTPVISDFWLEACPTEARVWLTPPEAARVERQWPSCADQCVRPKLIVVLDAPPIVLRANLRKNRQAIGMDNRHLQASRTSLGQLVNQGGHGPILWLDARDPDRMLSETCAAVAAMQPLEQS